MVRRGDGKLADEKGVPEKNLGEYAAGPANTTAHPIKTIALIVRRVIWISSPYQFFLFGGEPFDGSDLVP